MSSIMDSLTTGGTSWSSGWIVQGYWYAQGMLATKNYWLTDIEPLLDKSGTGGTGTIYVGLLNVNQETGIPYGGSLCSGSFLVSEYTGGYKKVAMSTPVHIQAGKKYAWYVHGVGDHDPENNVHISANLNNLDPNGNFYGSWDGSSWGITYQGWRNQFSPMNGDIDLTTDLPVSGKYSAFAQYCAYSFDDTDAEFAFADIWLRKVGSPTVYLVLKLWTCPTPGVGIPGELLATSQMVYAGNCPDAAYYTYPDDFFDEWGFGINYVRFDMTSPHYKMVKNTPYVVTVEVVPWSGVIDDSNYVEVIYSASGGGKLYENLNWITPTPSYASLCTALAVRADKISDHYYKFWGVLDTCEYSTVDTYYYGFQNDWCDMPYVHPADIGQPHCSALGQSFTVNTLSDKLLTKASFYLKKEGSPVGLMRAALYSKHPTTGLPDQLLDTSVTDIPMENLTTDYALCPFAFDGTTTLTAGTQYFIICYNASATTLDQSNHPVIGRVYSGAAHAGVEVIWFQGWNLETDRDLCFYVCGVNAPSVGNVFDDAILSECRAALPSIRTVAQNASDDNPPGLSVFQSFWININHLHVPQEDHEKYIVDCLVNPTEEKTDDNDYIMGRLELWKQGEETIYIPSTDMTKCPAISFARDNHLDHSGSFHFVIPRNIAGYTVTLQLRLQYQSTRGLEVQTYLTGYGISYHSHT